MDENKSVPQSVHHDAESPAAPSQTGNFGVQAAYFYSGNLPHPDHLERYEKLYPGAAEIVFKRFEQQGLHRQSLEKEVVPAQLRNTRLGIYIQGFSVLVYAAAAVATSIFTPPWVPVSMAAVYGITTIVIYCYGRGKQAELLKAQREAETFPKTRSDRQG
jgi:uncharacterized membrane protein